MIHLKLSAVRALDPDVDPLRRPRCGYNEAMGPDAVYQLNRGLWTLGARADTERYAAFSSLESKRIVCVVRIDHIDLIPGSGGKRAIVGRVLHPQHPVHDALVGQPAPDSARNPVTYLDSWLDQRLCRCGCGAPLTGRMFLPGHDQKAIHQRIEDWWGSVTNFLDWCDRKDPNAPWD